jgi:Helix-turn-helix domain
MTTSPWMRTGDVAEKFGISRKTVTTWVERGIIPKHAVAPRLPGQRVILIDANWVHNYQPGNITDITQARRERLTEADAELIADKVAEKLWVRMFGGKAAS